MGISLSKGQKVSLSKMDSSLRHLHVGLGWDVNTYSSGSDFDLDASAFLVGADGICKPENFIYYNNRVSTGIEHMGDNRTGVGDGDDEVIKLDLTMIPPTIEKIAVTVTIYEAEKRGQNFGQVSNAFIRLLDEETNQEILRYDLGEDYSCETALVVAEIYRHNGEWKFNPIGAGFNNGLLGLCNKYGIDATN